MHAVVLNHVGYILKSFPSHACENVTNSKVTVCICLLTIA